MEATPIISPPAKKQSMVRQLDLRITKTPNGKKGIHCLAVCIIRVNMFDHCVDVDFNDANDNLDHVIPNPTPSGSPATSQSMHM